MLQPLQLKDVSFRYSSEIAELRNFLSKAGFALGTAETLETVAVALSRDRAFRRDLTLHVWVLIDRCDRQISHSDLLGVLAIAAAGAHFAAEAAEDDAHDLLRFLMEARRSMDAVPTRRAESPERRTPASQPSPETALASTAKALRPISNPVDATSPSVEQTSVESADLSRLPVTESGGGKRLVWLLGLAVCLLALVSMTVWRYRKPQSVGDGTGTLASPASSASAVTSIPLRAQATPPIGDNGEAPHAETIAPPQAHVSSRTLTRATTSQSTHETPAMAMSVAPSSPSRSTAASSAVVSPAPIVRTPTSPAGPVTLPTPSTRPATASMSPASVVPRSTTAPTATPAATLSKQLGSSTIPAYASAPDADATTDGRKYPRLLRRRTASSMGNGNLVADLRPTAALNASGGGLATPVVGTVRPTSIGIMAGNLSYSPTPAYPAAALAARVQGEVKVQAEIDRDGNVVSARVVSGPPMLRDAAVDAIQHWRYKPYFSGGKAVPMSATAVVDFQLP